MKTLGDLLWWGNTKINFFSNRGLLSWVGSQTRVWQSYRLGSQFAGGGAHKPEGGPPPAVARTGPLPPLLERERSKCVCAVFLCLREYVREMSWGCLGGSLAHHLCSSCLILGGAGLSTQKVLGGAGFCMCVCQYIYMYTSVACFGCRLHDYWPFCLLPCSAYALARLVDISRHLVDIFWPKILGDPQH
jgi:hypothetical protein